MKQPNGQVAGHRCDDRLPKADGNVEERGDATKAIIQKEYGPPDVLELGDNAIVAEAKFPKEGR